MWPILTLAILASLAAAGVAAVLKRRRTLARQDDYDHSASSSANALTSSESSIAVIKRTIIKGCEEQGAHNESGEPYEVELPTQADKYEDQLHSQQANGIGLTPAFANLDEVQLLIPSGSEAEPARPQCASSVESELRDEPQRCASMRITKRSSGGRGEYEISESFGGITPRDILDRTIVLDLGCGIEIATGVRLLLRHGKRRLRIDETTGCEIHLHRQLAAALMLPYPAREESGWALDSPIMQSGLYGIANIAFSRVMLVGNGIAKVTVASVTVMNRGGEDYVYSPDRMADVKRLWVGHADLPLHLSPLVAEHRQLVEAGGPLGLYAEEVVSRLQQAGAEHCQAQGLGGFPPSQDVLPLLIPLLRPASAVNETVISLSEASSPQSVSTADQAQAIDQVAGIDEAATEIATQSPACDGFADLTNPKFGADIDSSQQEPQRGSPELHTVQGSSVEQEKTAQVESLESVEQIPVARAPSPHKYRPQPRGPIAIPRSHSGSTKPVEERDFNVPIDLRLRTRVGGTYVLSLLPRRRTGMPSDLEVIQVEQRIQQSALHEDWYQDVVIPELGTHLRNGLVWFGEDSNTKFRWNLAGREVFVLGTRDDLSGFVSVPRLILGARHFVICCEEILQRVLDVLRECCDSIPPILGEEDGLPPAWVGVGPVVPNIPLAPSEEGDILDSLRPDAAIAIALEGGIRLQQNQFLAGYPPEVRIYGSIPAYAQVLIDGMPAHQAGTAFASTGFDSPGQHVVSCGVVSRTYYVVMPDDGWESWPAYCVSLRAQQGVEASASICGALVTQAGRSALLVPKSTPVLLGSQPGEIYVAPVRQDLGMPVCAAFPSFTPAWAVPRDPLHADKRTVHVVALREPIPAPQGGSKRRLQPSSLELKWCIAILDCSRKGLSVDPPGDDVRTLWRSYRDLARTIWRASR